MDLQQEFLGCSHYIPDCETDGHILLIGVECYIGAAPTEVMALLDCAAEWSVLPTTIADELGYSGQSEGWRMVLSTRFGTLEGVVVNIPTTFKAQHGEDVSISARWFVSDYWYGPAVIGWRGCLASLNFALNQTENRIYFAPAESIGAA
jgi:hypothetical protein